MAGAWEIRNAHSVLVYTLHTDLVSIAWSYGFRNLVIPGDYMGLAGMPYDHARNLACMRCLEGGYEWLFSLDSDVIPPRDAILRLLARNQPIISGLYCRRSPPHGVPVMIRDGTWYSDFKPGSVVEVDLVGAGCLLLHRSVLESLPPQRPEAGKHWFDWRIDCQAVLPPGECLSEDFTMCQHSKRRGYKILVDTSVVCRHVGLAQSTFWKFEPCEATANT